MLDSFSAPLNVKPAQTPRRARGSSIELHGHMSTLLSDQSYSLKWIFGPAGRVRIIAINDENDPKGFLKSLPYHSKIFETLME
jgi:hypothetical protein